MNRPIKTVLVVGLGSSGRRHVRVIRSLYPSINIIVLRHKQCNSNDIKLLGLYKCVISINHAIELNPQVAVISNPASKHIEIAKKLAYSWMVSKEPPDRQNSILGSIQLRVHRPWIRPTFKEEIIKLGTSSNSNQVLSRNITHVFALKRGYGLFNFIILC